MSIANRLTDFLFTIGASVVSVLGRGELLSDHSIYGRFLNGPSKSLIDDYDSKDNQYKKEQTPVDVDFNSSIESQMVNDSLHLLPQQGVIDSPS